MQPSLLPRWLCSVAARSRSRLHVLVQDVHVDVGSRAKHVVRLVLAADRVQSTSYEVRPLVRLWRGSRRTSVALQRPAESRHSLPQCRS